MKEKNNKEVSKLALYVVFSILAVIVYTVVEQILSTALHVSHDTLTTCFYSVFGGEMLCCALIKIFKLKEGGKNAEVNENEEEDADRFPNTL